MTPGSVSFVVDTIEVEDASFNLSYRLGPEERHVDCRIRLTTTTPYFGGIRWWFRCPLSGRRVRKLYLVWGCDYFASRAALGLAYASTREQPHERLLRRRQKIQERLGGTGSEDELNCLPKPKWMRWKTFNRLMQEANEANERMWEAVGLYLRSTARR